jgi:tetratricopeptide (TPR) repeat protein
MNKRIALSLMAGLVLAVTAVALSPVLKAGFTNFDDQVMVTENIKIQNLSLINLKAMFGAFHYGLYHPLVLLSYAVEYRFFKLFPGVYHLTNLLLHLLNCWLVFRLFLLLSKHPWTAFIVALLFGIHPVHVESVAWVSERKDMLYAAFFLSSLLFYLAYCGRQRGRYLVYSFALFACSLLSKPMAVTLPLVLLLLDLFLGRGLRDRRAWLEKSPFFILSGLLVLVTVYGHRGASTENFFFIKGIFSAAYNILFYLYKLAVPVRLSALYPPAVPSGAPYPPLVLAAPLLIMALAAAVLFSRRWTKACWFGTAFFLVTLLPVLQFVPVGLGIPADRYLYLPALGIFFIAGTALVRLYVRLPHLRRYLLVLSCVITAITLSIISWQRAAVWHDSITLYNDVIGKYPQIALAYNNRGAARQMQGQYDLAMADFTRALQLNPGYDGAYNNRGRLHMNLNDETAALVDLEAALRINPVSETAHFNLGIIDRNRKDYDAAIRHFSRAYLCSGYMPAVLERAAVHLLRGERDAALDDYALAVRRDPYNPKAYHLRAQLYLKEGRIREAMDDYARVIELDPGNADAYCTMGSFMAAQGNYALAAELFTHVLELQPKHATAYLLRAYAYSDLKDFAAARADLRAAEALGARPDPALTQALETADRK